MKNTLQTAMMVVALLATSAAVAQQRTDDNRVDDRRRMDDQYERRDDRPDDRDRDMRDRERQLRDRDRDTRRDDRRRNDDLDQQLDSRRDLRNRQQNDPRYDNDYRAREDRNANKRYDGQDLSRAYDEGYDDGRKSLEKQQSQEQRQNYKNFTLGIYAGANSTRFQGEALDANGNSAGLTGRLGYQLGFFVRGGGRFYGQIGAEYLTSSSEFYNTVSSPGSGTTVTAKGIIGNVDQQYLQIPAYVGVKLAQSARGISGIRLQVGAEFATPLAGNNSTFKLERGSFNDATLNGLANIGFDAGPLFIDFVYHHGFQNVLKDNTSNSQRRILGVNVGVKF